MFVHKAFLLSPILILWTLWKINTTICYAGSAAIAVAVFFAANRLAHTVIAPLIGITFLITETVRSRLTNAQGAVADFRCTTVLVVSAFIDRTTLISNALRTVGASPIVAAFDIIDTDSSQRITDLTRQTFLITLTPARLHTLETNATEEGLAVVVDPAFTLKDATVVHTGLAIGAVVILSATGLTLGVDADFTTSTLIISAALNFFGDAFAISADLAYGALIVVSTARVLNTESEFADFATGTIVITLALRRWNGYAGTVKARLESSTFVVTLAATRHRTHIVFTDLIGQRAITISLTEERWHTATRYAGAATIAITIFITGDGLTHALIASLIIGTFIVTRTVGPR